MWYIPLLNILNGISYRSFSMFFVLGLSGIASWKNKLVNRTCIFNSVLSTPQIWRRGLRELGDYLHSFFTSPLFQWGGVSSFYVVSELVRR